MCASRSLPSAVRAFVIFCETIAAMAHTVISAKQQTAPQSVPLAPSGRHTQGMRRRSPMPMAPLIPKSLPAFEKSHISPVAIAAAAMQPGHASGGLAVSASAMDGTAAAAQSW